jgi:hypothetical protein
MITCNLNEIDTEPRLDDRSAELDGNGRVIQGSDGCATGRGNLPQRDMRDPKGSWNSAGVAQLASAGSNRRKR